MQPDAPAPTPLTSPPSRRPSARRATSPSTASLGLGELGEEIDDEWQYVQDLVDAWRTRLEDVEAARGDETLSAAARGVAVARVVDEARLIGDPHRAIDWLSTLPQVALVALGERP